MEMLFNEVREDVQNKVFRDVYKPLDTLSSNQFDRTINAVQALRRALNDQEVDLMKRPDSARPKAQTARTELNELVKQISAILDKMQGLAELNSLIKQIVEIDRDEEKLLELTRRVEKILKEDLFKSDVPGGKKDKKDR
jgi:hypothetical protein